MDAMGMVADEEFTHVCPMKNFGIGSRKWWRHGGVEEVGLKLQKSKENGGGF